MTPPSDESSRYPIGRCRFEASPPPERRREWLAAIAALPAELAAAVCGLDRRGLELRYRAGGWTIRQVVHHLVDSHMHGLIRTKLILTEDLPAAGTYREGAWAELADARETTVTEALDLVRLIHRRWEAVLTGCSPGEFARMLFHPQYERAMTLVELVGMYAWHGRHHLAHIALAKRRNDA